MQDLSLVRSNRKVHHYAKLNESSSTNHVCQWLKENRFEQLINTFRDFSGVDILRLSREDFVQICGLIDGIRLDNALHSRKLRAKLNLFVCQESPSMASRRRKKYNFFEMVTDKGLFFKNFLLLLNDFN